MRKALMTIGMALLLTLVLVSAVFFTTSSGPHLVIAMCNLILPGTLSLDEVSGTFMGSVNLQGMHYADGRDSVEIDRITFSVNASAILEGALVFDSLAVTGVHIDLLEELGESEDKKSGGPPPAFKLPFTLGARFLTIDNIFADLGNRDPLPPIDQIKSTGLSMAGERVAFSSLYIQIPNAEVTASGSINTAAPYPVELAMDYRLHPDGYSAIVGKSLIRGTLEQLAVDIDNTLPMPVQGALQLTDILTGLHWQGSLRSSRIQLSAVHTDWPGILLQESTLTGSGNSSSYRLALRSTTKFKNEDTTWLLTAHVEGDNHSVRFTDTTLAGSFGSLELGGELSWDKGLVWQGSLNAAGINPEFIQRQWPGSLDMTASFSGQKTSDPLQASFEVSSLSGLLRDYPLDGKAKVRLSGDRWFVDDLTLQSGGSTLYLSGEVDREIDLKLALHSQNLAEIWPGLSGTAEVEGKVGGTGQAPTIDLAAKTEGLGYRDLRLKDATARLHTDSFPDGAVRGSVSLQGLTTGDTAFIEHANLELEGTAGSHLLTARIENQQGDAQLRLSGSLKNNTVWSGLLDEVIIGSEQYGSWSLDRQQTLLLSPREIEVLPLCLRTMDNGRICLNGHWKKAGSWQAETTLTGLPVEMLEQMLEKNLQVDGLVQGSLLLSGFNTEIRDGSFQGQVIDPAVHDLLPEALQQSLRVKTNMLTGRLADNRLSSRLHLELGDGSLLTGEAAVENFEQLLKKPALCPVNGTINLSINDIEPLNALFNNRAIVSGSIHGAMSVLGTAEKPEVQGSLRLQDGRTVLPQLGITIQPLTAALTGDTRSLRITTEGRSGNGWIHGDGTVHLWGDDAPGLDLHVSGEEFEAVNLTEMKITASPDIDIALKAHEIRIHGALHIPSARIVPPDLSDAISPSADVIVDNGVDSREKLPVRAQVKMTMGSDVYVNAYGLKGRLHGELLVVEEPDKPSTGSGTLSIKGGTFALLDRELSLDVGRLLFTGGPLNNPGVEVRSENESEGVTTGIEVTGFLRRPKLRLYSNPYMEQAQILSRLLTSQAIGGSGREDSGVIGKVASMVGLDDLATLVTQTKKTLHIDDIRLETDDNFNDISLIIGSWLTPRFYVSYGRDLLNETGSFNTRYTLGKGFYLETETGATQSGGDINFEIER